MNLTTDQVSRLRSQLEDELNDIHDRLQNNNPFGLAESMETQIDELSHYDNHPGDIGSEMFERGKDLALRDFFSLRLNEVDDALERMEDGSYGDCQMCGQSISFARLEVEPAARYCLECQEHSDEQEISANRPVEENFLFPGFGRSNLDRDEEDYNGFDGEDAWQKVAAFGTAQTNEDNPYANEPNHFYVDADERIGYVEDLEGFLIADMHGNPIEPGFVRNEAYHRALDLQDDEENDGMNNF